MWDKREPAQGNQALAGTKASDDRQANHRQPDAPQRQRCEGGDGRVERLRYPPGQLLSLANEPDQPRIRPAERRTAGLGVSSAAWMDTLPDGLASLGLNQTQAGDGVSRYQVRPGENRR